MKILSLILLVLITGCAAVEKPIYPEVSYGVLPATRVKHNVYGSFTQWNQDYAISAKHIKGLEGDWACQDFGCDIVFFENKVVPEKVVQWRHAVPYEQLYMIGNIKRHFKKVVPVLDKDERGFETKEGQSVYLGQLTTGFPEKGMSGGPTYGEDLKIVGMTVAFGVFKKEGVLHTNGIYIPYEVILKEWEKFQASINKERPQ